MDKLFKIAQSYKKILKQAQNIPKGVSPQGDVEIKEKESETYYSPEAYNFINQAEVFHQPILDLLDTLPTIYSNETRNFREELDPQLQIIFDKYAAAFKEAAISIARVDKEYLKLSGINYEDDTMLEEYMKSYPLLREV